MKKIQINLTTKQICFYAKFNGNGGGGVHEIYAKMLLLLLASFSRKKKMGPNITKDGNLPFQKYANKKKKNMKQAS